MDQRYLAGWLSLAVVASLVASAPATLAQVDRGPGSETQAEQQRRAAPQTTEEQKAAEEEQKRKIEAVQNRNKAIEANNRGVKLQAENKNTEALEAFKEALLIDPSYENGRKNLAIAHYNLGIEAFQANNWRTAIENFEAARTYETEMREKTTRPLSAAYNNQAADLAQQGLLEPAADALAKAAELDSKYQPELQKLKDFIAQQKQKKR